MPLVEDEAFRRSITWFPWYLSGVLLLVALICWLHFRHVDGAITVKTTEEKK
jgi:hypothetical protein